MMTIEKVTTEIEKIKLKIVEYQSKLKTLELQKTEIENLKYSQIIRSYNMTPEELEKFLIACKKQEQFANIPKENLQKESEEKL